ncbi:MAG: hypothetical protein R6V40_01150 [Candidatus Moraniibacteriota bacterium]
MKTSTGGGFMSFVDLDFRLYSNETSICFKYQITSAENRRELFFCLKDFRRTLISLADECELLTVLEEKIKAVKNKEMIVQIKFKKLNDLLTLEGFVKDSHPSIVVAEKPSGEGCILMRVVFLYLKESSSVQLAE